MIDLPWMQIYVGDELAEASGLSAEEYGAHMFLRLHQWRHGELPHDEERLRRIAHVDADRWFSIRETLAPLFDFLWVHKRTADIRAQSEAKHKNLSENGKKGGRPRNSEKADEKPSFNSAFNRPKADEKQSQPQPQPPLHSSLNSKSQTPSDHGALEDKKAASTYASVSGASEPFPKLENPEDAKAFVKSLGLPLHHISIAIERVMAGTLFPRIVENWKREARAA
ncbi:DUF1376 domain-containing protein [Brucella sp. HL-2]|nr:DUF1376 domain-containing protein [Brucella sp. HL-2]MCV9906670.1 DUF1376 domain-containing protein [Brucella sp. HL-2]